MNNIFLQGLLQLRYIEKKCIQKNEKISIQEKKSVNQKQMRILDKYRRRLEATLKKVKY